MPSFENTAIASEADAWAEAPPPPPPDAQKNWDDDEGAPEWNTATEAAAAEAAAVQNALIAVRTREKPARLDWDSSRDRSCSSVRSPPRRRRLALPRQMAAALPGLRTRAVARRRSVALSGSVGVTMNWTWKDVGLIRPLVPLLRPPRKWGWLRLGPVLRPSCFRPLCFRIFSSFRVWGFYKNSKFKKEKRFLLITKVPKFRSHFLNRDWHHFRRTVTNTSRNSKHRLFPGRRPGKR